jgi:HlyD family secretion protein
VSGTGAVQAARQVPLVFELPGLVAEVMVEAGDRVQAGDVLARLDTSDLQTAVENARLARDIQLLAFNALTQPARPEDVAAAQAAVDAAQAQLNASFDTGVTPQQEQIAQLQSEIARNQLWQAQLQRDIANNAAASTGGGLGLSVDVGSLLPENSGVTPEQIEQANQAINQALAGAIQPSLGGLSGFGSTGAGASSGLNQAEFGVQIADASAAALAARSPNAGSVAGAQASLVSAQAALDRLINGANERDLQIAALGVEQAEIALAQAEAALARAQIVAPFDGVVGEVNLRVGELPPSQETSILLIDDSRLLVDLAIDETDVVDLVVGQPVELRLDALPDTPVTGTVTRVADAPIIAAQLVTYPVRVEVARDEVPIRIGMSTTATVIVEELEGVLVLANRFIRIDRATQQAFATLERTPGQYEEVPITLGLRNETESQILSGLNAGDRVVLLPRGTFDIFDGPPPQ